MGPAIGKVYLVGAGPGDPDLITLRGLRCLREADIVLFDYLANEHILDHAADSATLTCLGRHGRGRLMSQQEVNGAMIAAAQAGQTVVRLKGGDPTIFARAREEIEALEAHRIPYEIVPGVTAAVAAASCAGIPMTDREFASCVALVTGQENRDKGESALDYASLAQFPGTLVFYMGVTTAPVWSQALIENGMSPSTPIAVIRRGSLPDQQIVKGRLEDAAKIMTPSRIRPPAIVIVGPVAQRAQSTNWFTARPLFGQTILVTRPAHQTKEMVDELRRLGARVLSQPAIEIGPPDDWKDVDACLARLGDFDWVVFSSGNGVEYFLQRLEATGRDMRALGNVRLAAIGPATAAALQRYHLRADVQPAEYRAEALAAELVRQPPGSRFLLVRASRGREVLAQQLTQQGHQVTSVVVYVSRDAMQPAKEIAAELKAGKIDWITVTSSAIARSLVRLCRDDLKQARLAAISPLTASTLADEGFPPQAIARQYTTAGIIDAILAAG